MVCIAILYLCPLTFTSTCSVGDREGSEILQQCLGCSLCAVDTIRNAHAVIGIPGEYQAGALRHARGDMGYAVQMPDMVLRHRLQMAGDAHSHGLASKAQQLPQVMDDGLLYLRI